MAFKIYRIESHRPHLDGKNKVNEGCYTHSTEITSLLHKAHNNYDYPSIRHEFSQWEHNSVFSEHFCGVRNIKALCQWFNIWIPILMEYDYRVVEYTVTEFKMGDSGKQLIFHPDHVIKSRIVLSKEGGSIKLMQRIADYLTKL